MRNESNDNVLFTTEQCNNHCLMCCQPPRKVDDMDALMNENLNIIHASPDDIPVVCISGGEPTLLGDRLLVLIDAIREKWAKASIHILSNGRTFQNIDFVRQIKAHSGDDLFIGVPLHSDYERDHDLIAGAKGAYRETMTGIYNLASENIDIELRIVINKMNFCRLSQMGEFIYKNLPFVEWVAFMGMERCGYAVKNESKIWIEPKDYAIQLERAVTALYASGIETAIYNIPLCLIPETIHRFAARSISDWKVQYEDRCESCQLKEQCCGLFATSKKPYVGLEPILK